MATSILGAILLQEAEDRRLREAALVLLQEVATVPVPPGRIDAIVQHEHEETKHAGIRFVVTKPNGHFLPELDARGSWLVQPCA